MTITSSQPWGLEIDGFDSPPVPPPTPLLTTDTHRYRQPPETLSGPQCAERAAVLVTVARALLVSASAFPPAHPDAVPD